MGIPKSINMSVSIPNNIMELLKKGIISLRNILPVEPDRNKLCTYFAKAALDKKPRVRANAVYLLGDVADNRYFDIVEYLLNDEEVLVRRFAVGALGKFKNNEVLSLLDKFREDPDEIVRKNVIFALKNMDSRGAKKMLKKMFKGGNMRPNRIQRIHLLIEPPPGIDLESIPRSLPPDFKGEFIRNADSALQMCGDLISFVDTHGLPNPEVIEWIGDTDKETYFSKLTSAARWEVYYASRRPGIRYNLLVEYNMDWLMDEMHEKLNWLG